MESKLSDYTKRCAILDVNLIKLSRKYDCLTEEYSHLKHNYETIEADNLKREGELIEKLQELITWKKQS